MDKGGNVDVADVGEEYAVGLIGLLLVVTATAAADVVVEDGVRTFQSLTDQSRPDERARSVRFRGPWDGWKDRDITGAV